MFRQPTKHFAMPVLAVTRLQDPVPLVGEVDEARRHSLALQRREHLDAFADRRTKIEIVVDDEHRRLEFAEVAGEAVRRMLLVTVAILAPGRAAVLPFIEP